ncbi:MAG: hypothetical protein K0S27_1702 [Gammaproteobacteria bacterium]|jgi:hypothetical protein|nr:hypothetical protein [Gammaproteobacteria bacterium]
MANKKDDMNKIQKKEDFMIYVEKRLEHWAKWFKGGNHPGLGFRSETIEYVLMTVGIMIKSTGVKPLPFDEDAEEIEALVTEMASYNSKIAAALRIYYFDRRKSRDRAYAIQLSATQFNHYVNMAKQWLAGRLSGYRNN